MAEYETIRSARLTDERISEIVHENCIKSWQREKDTNKLSDAGAARVAEASIAYKDAEKRFRQKVPQAAADEFMRTRPTLSQLQGASRMVSKEELSKINAKWRLRTSSPLLKGGNVITSAATRPSIEGSDFNYGRLTPEQKRLVDADNLRYRDAEALLRARMPQSEADAFMATRPTLFQLEQAVNTGVMPKNYETINREWKRRTGIGRRG